MSDRVDVLIIGGGIAGLWALDELHRRGYSVLLVEHRALGAGQTVCSQGIIHGGIKYTLSGLLTPSADAIREMPSLWNACLRGRAEPKLAGVRILSPCCYLWRTASLASRLGLIGAQVGLRTAAALVDRDERPAPLRDCPGDVLRVAEPVLDMPSVLAALAGRHRTRIAEGEIDGAAQVGNHKSGMKVRIRAARHDTALTIRPRRVVLTAGEGNARLRPLFGLSGDVMQRRPLHMVLVRGPLLPLYGHCVDGARTRATITTNTDAAGRTVWHVGGEMAEGGVRVNALELIDYARRELTALLPGANFAETEWATYRIDRAEGRTSTGAKPDRPTTQREGDVLSAWPTKLALAPRLATVIAEELTSRMEPDGEAFSLPDGWPVPEVARPPWETCGTWHG